MIDRIGCVCDTDGDQLSLIHLPCIHKRANTKPTPGVRYTKYHPKTRQLCADCVTEIHRLGVAKAPLPRPVRWRRTTAEGSTHLCETHKDQRQEQEQ